VGAIEVLNGLASMQALDLVRTDGGSTDYVFKHALVRDALYESLLTERRQGLHARTAEEIEHRSGNRLAEVAEILAYHYSHTGRVGKAFAYLSLAGTKSLSIYSLDEAATHLTAALALLDRNPDCASDAQVVDFLLWQIRAYPHYPRSFQLFQACRLRVKSTGICSSYFISLRAAAREPQSKFQSEPSSVVDAPRYALAAPESSFCFSKNA
jgi:hypothetical protein